MPFISRVLLLLTFVICCQSVCAQSYRKIHRKAILADTHNDILEKAIPKGYSFDHDLRGKTHSDLNRFRKGGVDVQMFSIWCDGNDSMPYAIANRQIDTLYATANRNPNKIMMVKNLTDLNQALKEKKLAAMIGVEGGHMIENDLGKLHSLYERGARYLTLTHNVSTPWATSAREETHDSLLRQPKGLNDFGRKVVTRMNEFGMMVDVSHVGEKTFYDVLAVSTKPIIASHSSVYNLCPVPRNLKDEQIRAIAKNGGVIFINFYSGFLDSTYDRRKSDFLVAHKAETDSLKRVMPAYRVDEYYADTYPEAVEGLRAPLSMVVDHIDYVVKLAGIDHVGIGSDFDGIEAPPQQLDGVECFPILTKALLKKGYSRKDVEKILGGNFLRVLEANTPGK